MTLPPVTVIGLGPMGHAMAQAFLAAGHATTVFNRSPGKADDLVRAGATQAGSAAEAVAASDVTVLSLTHYRAMYDLLAQATGDLAGKTLVNLSSDTPSEAERASAWASGHGADLLVGGVMVNAPLIGKPDGYTLYSGPQTVFDRHRALLEVLTRADYRGPAPGLAQLWYQALLDVFMTTLATMQHGAAMIESGGVTAAEFLPYARDLLGQMGHFTDGMAAQIDARDYPDTGASVTMMSAGIGYIVDASVEAGIDPGLPAAVQGLYHRALADDRGEQSSTSLIELIKRPLHEEDAA